jgi:hypothetical protein
VDNPCHHPTTHGYGDYDKKKQVSHSLRLYGNIDKKRGATDESDDKRQEDNNRICGGNDCYLPGRADYDA